MLYYVPVDDVWEEVLGGNVQGGSDKSGTLSMLHNRNKK